MDFEEFEGPGLSDALGSIRCTRAGEAYDPTRLSDGEKQILILMADLVFASPPGGVFLIDEPELHLQPKLAETFWTTIEEQRPEAIFVYATHSLPFAMRRSVDTCLVLGKPGQAALVIESFDQVPSADMSEFLGVIPGILKAGRALVTEGKPVGSFDRQFYRWMLNDPSAEIVPVESCTSVEAATRHTGVWSRLAPNVTICGVVDRDYRPSKEKDEACLVLTYHEAESYLCEPKLVADLGTKLYGAEHAPTEAQVRDAIVDHCARHVRSVAGQRAIQLMPSDLSFSLKTGEYDADKTDDRMLDAFITVAKSMANTLVARAEPATVKAAVSRELKTCRDAIQAKDMSRILSLFSGKQLLSAVVCKLMRLHNNEAVVLAAMKHVNPDDYPSLRDLRKLLQERWTSRSTSS